MFLILSLVLCGQTFSPLENSRRLSDAPPIGALEWNPPGPGDCGLPPERGEAKRQKIRGPKGRRGKALNLCDTLYPLHYKVIPKVPGESRRKYAIWTSVTTFPGASDA